MYYAPIGFFTHRYNIRKFTYEQSTRLEIPFSFMTLMTQKTHIEVAKKFILQKFSVIIKVGVF